MEKENKNLKVVIALLSILVVILLILGIYFIFIKKDKKAVDVEPSNNVEINEKNNTEGLKDSDGKDISIDYENLEKELIDNVDKNGYLVYLDYCKDCTLNTSETDDIYCSKKTLSKNSIVTIINKLKSASKVEFMPTGRNCAVYTYSISNQNGENLLVAYEADDASILLVGIKGQGYAYHFNGENIINFFNSLQ